MLARSLESSNNRDGSSQLFVDHKSEDSHHGGTSVVELDGTLGELGLFVEVVPSEVEGSVSEVTDELVSGSWDVLHDTELEDSDEGEDLDGTERRHSVRSGDGGPSVRDGLEGLSILADGTIEVDTVSGDNLSEEGKHGDTSVLDLNVSETVEFLLVTVFDESERIEVSKRWLGTEDILESGKAGGGLGLLDRGEGAGGGDEGGENGRLHFGDNTTIQNKRKLKL